MITPPRLDDRTYDDIVAEALRLIPRYCPDWTDHNPSDPGIAILELSAWMTEILLYRINRVPEKNYVAFLNMLGIQLRPAQPARGLITFELVEGADRQTIAIGTQVATQQGGDDDTIIFETQRELMVSAAKLDRCFSYFNDKFTDNSLALNGAQPDGFEVFGGATRLDRYLYLGDQRFASITDSALLRLFLAAPEHGGRDLSRLLEWEYWNGRRWRELRMSQLEVERGEAIFFGPPDIELTTVNGSENYWLRGRLAEVPKNPTETELDTVKGIIEISGEGVTPELALTNLADGVFLALDIGKNFFPLGQEPKADTCFYVASSDLFAQVGAEVRIEIALSDTHIAPEPQASAELVLSWEYFDGKKWRILSKVTPEGPVDAAENKWAFFDGTNAFTQSGQVQFNIPDDISPGEVNGEASYWLRVRVERGDYGSKGNYMLDGDQWVFRDDRPLRPPSFRLLLLRYRADLQNIKQIVSYNDFRYDDHSQVAKVEYRAFQPFSAVGDEGAAIYFGWDRKLPNATISVGFTIADGIASDEGKPNFEFLRAWYAERDALWEAEQRLLWEYWNGKQWVNVIVVDGTRNFSQNGFVDFVAPEDFEKSFRFAEERFWLRARLEMGGYVRPPRVQRVLTNTVEAAHVITFRDERLGSSDGTPLQNFTFHNRPLLEGEVVEVFEKDRPNDDDVQDLDANAVRADNDGHWVRWRAVESFFDSGPRSRHYLRNGAEGKISFGDGRRGFIPPAATDNVFARFYQVGGGVRGNVNANTLTQLTRAVAYVERCYNPVPAAGGSDAETVTEAKERAPLTLKSRDRAVTVEDFEALALRASTGVGRARCLPSETHDGRVQVVVVPRGDERTLDLTQRLVPAPELLRQVQNYLDERRLVGTMLEVVRPTYVELSLKITLLRRAVGASDRIKREIETRLRQHLHPLLGGRDGKGWPFGRSLYKTDLMNLIESLPGVENIDSVTIFDEDRRVAVEQVRLEAAQLIQLVNVLVVERVREEIA